jgi:rare lipoprotein A (peptidoglycan hydrolase)
MKRCASVGAACLWLLAACGDAPMAKAPPDLAKQPKTAQGSHISLLPAAGKDAGVSVHTTRPERPASGAQPAETEQLAQRFAGVRALEVQQGTASYYSDAFAGRSTASGAPYEPRRFTAAHRNLPFGSVLRVTRRDGGQVVYVKVTDRGPFKRGRIVDLSRAAAEQLGMIRAGVVKVKVEVLEYGPRKSRRRRR